MSRMRPAAALLLALVTAGCSSATPTASPAPTTAPAPATASATPASTDGPTAGPVGGGSPTPDASAAASAEDALVASALAALPDDRARVGQLLMVGWPGTTAESARATLVALKPGGIVFVGVNANTAAEARRINGGLRQIAAESIPLAPFIAIDHEGGAIQRIDDVPNLGSNREFADTHPTIAAACARGRDHAEQLHGMGFSVDLAPVLDVATNPDNPVIGDRSYGPDPDLVARLGAAYVRGMQADGGGIVAVGKHFPGHGDTNVDSHRALPVLDFDVDRLERIELVPFRAAIADQTRIAAIMVGHIALPKLDARGRPATLSRPIVTGLLRERLGFDGLVISDDMAGMQAITDKYKPGLAAVEAIRAGVDMLIMGSSIGKQRQARDALLAALRNGKLSRGRLDDALRHVLRVKARFGVLEGREAEPLGATTCD